MRKFTISGLLLICLLLSVTSLFAQRKHVNVPKVDPSAITIDAKANEAAWNTAATANVITNTGFDGWFNYYYRDVVEPDYQELWAKMLWAKDTLFVFIHIKDTQNDSTGLYWNKDNHWSSDQLFVSVSSQLGREMQGWYDGNVYAAPGGPYHFLILGNRVTLNDSSVMGKPAQYMTWPGDTVKHAYNAYDICRAKTSVDTVTGIWNIEMAIYNPNINAGGNLGFNFGGSQSSFVSDTTNGDAYAYWTWQPNVVDSPFAIPATAPGTPGDPGGYNLVNSEYWALLDFVPGPGDAVRKVVPVPRVNPADVKIDAKANEAAWSGAATANVITNTGFDGWFNYYYRDVVEPDYQEMWAKMLWAKDTLYAFIHIKDTQNDSTGLYWNKNNHWSSDQLFVSLSSRLGKEMQGWYDGNVYAAPGGPYHFLILGNRVTLNDSSVMGKPAEWMTWPGDTIKHAYNAYDICRAATSVDTVTGIWNIEMAIYNPNVAAESKVGFNFGGSQSSFVSDTANGDAYAYWTWQPNVVDSPFAIPATAPGTPGDPGGYNLVNSAYWALLRFDTTKSVVNSVTTPDGLTGVPTTYVLSQNYPNPFNPTTSVRFALPHAGKVEMKVYNLLGQVVATLVNGQYATGSYEVKWDAKSLASGLYFYRLTVDNNVVATKKMMLLK
jgi:hypothetical protein